MIEVRGKVQLLIMLSVWAILLLEGCKPPSPTATMPPPTATNMPPPTATNTPPSTPTNTPSPTATSTKIPTPEAIGESPSLPTDKFTNTAAFFLLDSSTSIQELCEPEVQEWRTAIPEFFITYAHAYHHNERGRNEEFKIGWATFPPTKTSSDLRLEGLNAFDNYPDWNRRLKNDLVLYNNGLDFADSLDNVVEQLNGIEYSHYQKIIFLISETYLDYNRDSPNQVDEEKERIIESLNNIPADWSLYIIQLPCNLTNNDYGQDRRSSDTGWWRETVKDYDHIHLLEREDLSTLKNVADNLFKDNDNVALKNLLPWESKVGQYGWGWIDGQNITLGNGDPATWQTDGDTSHLNITAVAAGANDGFQLLQDDSTVGIRGYPAPNSNTALLYTYSYAPKQIADGNCANYRWQFQPVTSDQNTVGIFWWRASYPKLELSVNVDPPGILNNLHSFSVTATLRGGDDSCYRSQLKINHQIYFNVQGHPELKNIINMVWNDIPYDPSKIPLHFPVTVEILHRNPNVMSERPTDLILKEERWVEVKFTPVLSPPLVPVHVECVTCSIASPITKTVVSLIIDYASHYHHNVPAPLHPEIYLITEKTRSGQIADGCNQDNLSGNNFPILPNNDYLLENSGPSLYAYKVDVDGTNFKVEPGPGPEYKITVTANIPMTWQDFCAYTQLLLQWPDEISQTDWRGVLCPLDDGGLCVDYTDRVVRR